jgi:transposase
MMGRHNRDQGQLFYSFCLDEVVPADHRVRDIAAVLDLSWVHAELAPYYPSIGRPSIDPVLMIRMLIVGYVFAIRSSSHRPIRLRSGPVPCGDRRSSPMPPTI